MRTGEDFLCSAENEQHDIVPSASVHGDGLPDVCCVIPSHEVLLLSLIDAAPDGGLWSVPMSGETEPASS